MNSAQKHWSPSDTYVHMSRSSQISHALQVSFLCSLFQDGDFLPMPDAPPMSLLPPINGKKGPGNQSSMANLKATNGTNNSTLSSKGQSLPTGIIRGSVPEELKGNNKKFDRNNCAMHYQIEVIVLQSSHLCLIFSCMKRNCRRV